MKNALAILAVILLATVGIGLWQGWFSITKGPKLGVVVDTEKIDQDKKSFSKSMGEKAVSLKETISGLWKKSDSVKAEEATGLKKELEELNKSHDELEKQIKAFVDTGLENYETAKADLVKSLAAVDAKIQSLTQRIEKAAGK